MPTYEYRCRACEHRFDRFQKISDDPVKTCPECGEEEAERLISSGGGLVFKGSGFYATDYRDSGPPGKKGKGEEGGAASSDAGDGETSGSGGPGSNAGGDETTGDADGG